MFAAPAATTHGALFPTACHAKSMDGGGLYSYLRINSTGVYFLGYAGDVEGDEMVVFAEPEVNLLPLPLTYGATWTSVWRMDFETEYGPMTTVDSSVYAADGWGTLQTPFGEWDVLRLQQHHYYMLAFPDVSPMILIEEYAYHWLRADGYLGASVSQGGLEDPDPNFTVGNINIAVLQAQSADPARGPLVTDFAVGANYPNPFNPSTTLPLELRRAGQVTLTVYDETGRAVHTREMDLSPGHHALPIDGSAWSSGTYFARVNMNGREAATKKMLLIK